MLSLYAADPENLALHLPRMAHAHIWHDLRSILAKLPQEVPRLEYERVNFDIIWCLGQSMWPGCDTTLEIVVNVIYVSGTGIAWLTIPGLRELVYLLARRDRAKLEHRIHERAYDLASQRGFAPGHDWEDWFQAEEEIRAKPC